MWMTPESYDFEFRIPTSADNESTTDANGLMCQYDLHHWEHNNYSGYPAPQYGDFKRMPGYYEQLPAWEMDNALSICEEKGVYLLLTLFPNQACDHAIAIPPYAWDGGNQPYYNYLEAVTSHTVPQTVYDFLTDSRLIQLYKNHLFYVLARWGYSPNIASWEMVNEIDGYGMDALYSGNTTVQQYSSNWVTTMQKYIKTLEPRSDYTHLFTNSYGSGPGTNGVNSYQNDNSSLSYDFLTSHSYTYNSDDPSNQFYYRMKVPHSSWALNTYYPLYTSINKPFLFGEMGHDPNKCYVLDVCSDNGFHGSSWSSAFMSSGAGLYWFDWEQFTGTDHRANFAPLKTFFSQVDFQNSNFDYTKTGYSLQAIGSITTNPPQDVEQYYLNDNTNGTQIGWINNITVNYGSYNLMSCNPPGHCYTIGFPPCHTNYDDNPNYQGATIAVVHPLLTFRGLKPDTKYKIYFFNTFNQLSNTQTGLTSDVSGDLYSNYLSFASSTPSYTSAIFDNSPDYAYIISPCPTCRYASNRGDLEDPISLKIQHSVTSGQFSITLKDIDAAELGQTAEVNIYNIIGQCIYKETMQVQIGATLTINMPNQPKGMYIIMVKTIDRVLHGKVIMQ